MSGHSQGALSQHTAFMRIWRQEFHKLTGTDGMHDLIAGIPEGILKQQQHEYDEVTMAEEQLFDFPNRGCRLPTGELESL